MEAFDRRSRTIPPDVTEHMRYSTLLFDLDHTLLDSVVSEAAAFDATLRAVGWHDPSLHFAEFVTINKGLWSGVERGELSPNDVRRLRFDRFIASTGIDADPEEMAEIYVLALGAHGDLLPGARSLLDSLADRTTLALVTNGIGDVQRARIARTGIERYFDAIVISGEVGASKPGREIFDLTFRTLGYPPLSGALMVGDSLASDILGGIDYGIDTCWYHPDDTRTTDLPVTHRVTHLDQIPPIAIGR